MRHDGYVAAERHAPEHRRERAGAWSEPGRECPRHFEGTRLLLRQHATPIAPGNLLTASVASGERHAWVALGMIVTGLGAGILNGDTQKAIMACVPPERIGMASAISTTTLLRRSSPRSACSARRSRRARTRRSPRPRR
jgi:hypothetical protein